MEARARWRRVRTLAARLAAAAGLAASSPAARAADAAPPVSPPELDRAIAQVLQRPEYTWRMPREADAKPARESGFVAAFFREIAATVRRWAGAVGEALQPVRRGLRSLVRWLFESEGPPDGTPHPGWQNPVRAMLFALLAVTGSALAIAVYRLFRGRHRAATVVATQAAPRPDLSDESVSADLLPSDGWMDMAREFLARGDFRLAIRAMFLASLASLAHGGRLTLAACKSNRDYVRELDRRTRDGVAARAAFRDNVAALERVWYGRHAATAELAEAFRTRCEELSRTLPARPAPPEERVRP